MATIPACYAICGTAVATCFTAAGFVWGTVPGAQIAATPALANCVSTFASCEAACMAVGTGLEAAGYGLLGAAVGAAFPVTAVAGAGYFVYKWFFSK